ncbi:hypothetical protein MHTCC0001_20540 [Flavobacteriaceae bacterium MHTCC 0001]
MLYTITTNAQPDFNNGQDPKPSNMVWEKINDLSDEFEGTSLDTGKWLNTDPDRWVGRDPGIFKKDVVSLENSNLRITNRLLDQPEVVNGNTYTHAGGSLTSLTAGQIGYYYECRMKASKTFMSSTFWLINKREESTGCDRRVTELDIQECVGEITNSSRNFDESMHSNTHSRNTSCNSTPTGSEGNNVDTQGKVWAAYHTYGAWWKSKSEIVFFLDGNEVYTITPKADFDIPMYIRLVTETYNWNPVPADGGMTGSFEERTTYYDWVRTWKLVDNSNSVPVTGVTVTPATLSLQVGETSNLTATITPSNATNQVVTWSSSDSSIASVNSNGMVTAVAEGTASITVTTDDGNFSDLSTVTVIQTNGGTDVTTTLSPIHDAYIQGSNGLNNSLIRIESGRRVGYLMYDLSGISGTITNAELRMTCTGDSGSGNININLGNGSNWTETNLSSTNAPGTGALLGNLNSNYAIGTTYTWALDANALSGGGNVTLIATQTGGNDTAFASKENANTEPQLVITYSTDVNATGVSVAPTSLSLNVGETSSLTATITPSDATNQAVTWSSSDSSIASVNSNGMVTAVAEGTATITVTTDDGNFSDLSTVTVTQANGGTDVTTTLSPIHDAYIQGSSGLNNSLIRIESGRRVGYLMYNLNGISGTITNAELKMTCTGDSGSGNININLGNGSNWTETNLSSANAPGTGALLGSLNSNYAIGTTYTWALDANALSGGGNVTLIATQTGGNDAAFASKENSVTEPQLVITYMSSSAKTAYGKTNKEVIANYTNPYVRSNGDFKVNILGDSKAQIQIFNISGALIFKASNVIGEKIIPKNYFKAAGLYIVHINTTNNNTVHKKLAVK